MTGKQRLENNYSKNNTPAKIALKLSFENEQQSLRYSSTKREEGVDDPKAESHQGKSEC